MLSAVGRQRQEEGAARQRSYSEGLHGSLPSVLSLLVKVALPG